MTLELVDTLVAASMLSLFYLFLYVIINSKVFKNSKFCEAFEREYRNRGRRK